MVRAATALLIFALGTSHVSTSHVAPAFAPAVAPRYDEAGRSTSDVHELLRIVGGFGPAQLAALDRGEALARILKTDRREVAVIGAVRIKGARERMVERFRRVANLRNSDLVMQVGVFGPTPQPGDLAGLTFEQYDVDAIRECRPGDCPVRLSKEAIARMQGAIDWRAPDARSQSARAWRQVLADVAVGYTRGGDSALLEYVNKAEPLSVATELNLVYEDFAHLFKRAPHLAQHIKQYPNARIDGAENVLFWSKSDLGVRPVVSITHQTIYAPPSGPMFIAAKRIYAMHYIDAGLGVTMLTDDGDGGFYMTILERIRTRSLTGFSRAVVRSVVQDKTREGVEKMLRGSKRALESRIPDPRS